MQISLYKGILPDPTESLDYKTVLEYIQNDKLKLKPLIERIRKEKSKTRKTELKKQLPSTTWSGLFSYRNADSLTTYSGIICADIDGIEMSYAQQLKEEMQADAYVLAAFLSPSGGLKVLFTTTQDSTRHLDFYYVVESYMKRHYNVDIDAACKDVNRLCFLCVDADILINHNAATLFTETTKVPKQKATTIPAAPTLQVHPSLAPGAFNPLEKCHEIASRKAQPIAGQSNKYIMDFAAAANRYGINENDCIDFIKSKIFHRDFPDKDDLAVIKNQYTKFAAEHNKFNDEYNAKKVTKPTIQPAKPSAKKQHANYNTDELFWYTVTNEKTGKVELKFSYDDAINFLQNNGFFKYRIDKGKYSLIKVDKINKIIDIVNELQVKEFFLEFLKHAHPEIETTELKAVREMFRRGAKNYCGANLLEGLEYFTPNFKRDTQTTAYVYFKNCFLKITAAGAEPTSYQHLDGFIWEKQIIDFNYSKVDYTNFDFTKFLIYCITGVEQTYQQVMEQPADAIDKRKFTSLISSLGYMIHNYKNPAITKAVVAVDSKKRTQGESNGRSGKSLIAKAIAKMANMCLIDGKNFKFDYEFAFDRVSADTKFINFNDVNKNFDFEKLFGLITEDFIYSKKKLDSITIPFADSPKIYVSTNYTLKGEGESMLGRQQIIEVSNFFTSTRQPVNVFGKMFFNDWNEDDYNCFYSLFCDCIKLYLADGLLKFPLENYDENKLIDTAGESFIEYMQDIVLEQLGNTQEFCLTEMFDKYKQNYNLVHLKSNSFTKWTEMWANVNNLFINAHKQGARDRRNGKTYVTFTTKQSPIEQTTITSPITDLI